MSNSAPNQTASLAERIAVALGGVERRDKPGSWLACCPCPGHGNRRGDQKRSLAITQGDDGRLLLYCFAGCEFAEMIAALEDRGILSNDWQEQQPTSSTPRPPQPHEPDATALELWRKGSAVKAGSAVDRYLRGRGITIDAPPTLRDLHTTVVISKKPYRKASVDVMLAAVQRPDGMVVSVQRTVLVTGHNGIPHRLGTEYARRDFGSLGHGAVRLAEAGEILGLSEGTETGLAAMQLTGVPVWASLGSHRLARVEIPESVKELHVFADRDDVGREAAEKVADIHAAERKVILRAPPKGFSDWNDALVGFYKPQGLNDWNDIARLDGVEVST
jgi:putative DNA primase/helicase